ncbi:hypothetical protein TTRE_0000620801 [Trichuris trichiura]|uniref:Myb-like domain-containing protein n=1 Tax=Trichuris trichiura TaxID=36087 RepID=A0A077ZED9_TRITR|nr:hypothetical protein TTRE_0000620801 [Trichuris trichiura]
MDDQGRIIIDEESLEVDETEAVNKLKPLTMCSKPVLNSCTYRKRLWKRGPPWTTAETENFYKALSYVGADFQSMLQYFPNRSREDLKRKFIKEELCNRRRIDHALCTFLGNLFTPFKDATLATPASDLVPSFEEFDLKNEADSNEAFEVEDSKEPLAAIVAEQEDGIRRKMQRHSKSETSEEVSLLFL